MSKHKWSKVVFWDTNEIGYVCKYCKTWRLKGEPAGGFCKGKR